MISDWMPLCLREKPSSSHTCVNAFVKHIENSERVSRKVTSSKIVLGKVNCLECGLMNEIDVVLNNVTMKNVALL